MTGADRALAVGFGALCLGLIALGTVTETEGPHWLGLLFFSVGALALLSAVRRPQRVILDQDTLTLPSWVPGRAAAEIPLATLVTVEELPARWSNALSNLYVRARRPLAALVPRSTARELADRIRLRAYARRLDAPDAIELLETYFVPGAKPLGVIRRDDRWVPFHDIAELPKDRDLHYREQRQSIPVVMEPSEFSLLQRACPDLSFHLLTLKVPH